MPAITVSFKVPRELLKELDDLIEKGVFSTRSEAIRHALSMLIRRYSNATRESAAAERR